jgi:hypothetical protein
LLKIFKNKKNNTFIVSERQYIGIIATINGFRSTLASCEVGQACSPPPSEVAEMEKTKTA